MSSTAKVINCAICGKEVESRTHNRKYCDACSIIVRNKRKPVKVVAPPVEEAQCLNCKKTYRVTPNWSSSEFCCDACRVNYRWRQKYGKPYPEKTLGDWLKEAQACGLDYGTYRGLLMQGKTFEELKSKI